MCNFFIARCSQTSIHGWHNYYLWNKFYKKIAPSDFHFQISLPMHTTKTPIDKWRFNVTQLKEFFTFSVKDRYQLNYNVFYLYQRLQWTDITSLKLNLFYFFIYTAVSIMKGKRPVLIYFCYQTDSGVPNTSIYSSVFLASPYYNYL